MELATILVILAALVAVLLFFRFIGSIIKTLFFALGLALFIIIILGLIAYSDAKQVQHSLQNGDVTLIYQGDEPLTIKGLKDNKDTNTSLTLTVQREWLWAETDQYTVMGKTITQESFEDNPTQEDFISILSMAIENSDKEHIITGLKDGTISIKPKLISITIIKLIPDKLLDKALGEINLEEQQ